MGWREKVRKKKEKITKRFLCEVFNQRTETIFVVIDAQKYFCDPQYEGHGTEETDATCKNIQETANTLRKAGIDICWLYTDKYMEGIESAFGGLHHCNPAKHDLTAYKTQNSALYNGICPHLSGDGELSAVLKNSKKQTLIIAGFNLSACVEETAKSALLNGYDVIILNDLCRNDRRFNDRHALSSFRFDLELFMRAYRPKLCSALGNIYYTDSQPLIKKLKKDRAKDANLLEKPGLNRAPS